VTGPINLGNPGECTILELAQSVISLTGSSSKIVHRPPVSDDPRQRCPDITQAKSVLKWSPSTSRQEGLKRTVEYFRQTIGC
jgi:UDP-glucuronate decarboxylase